MSFCDALEGYMREVLPITHPTDGKIQRLPSRSTGIRRQVLDLVLRSVEIDRIGRARNTSNGA